MVVELTHLKKYARQISDHFPKFRGENRTCLKPPPSYTFHVPPDTPAAQDFKKNSNKMKMYLGSGQNTGQPMDSEGKKRVPSIQMNRCLIPPLQGFGMPQPVVFEVILAYY